MKNFTRLAIAASCLTLGACWTSGDDTAAQNVEQQHENKADQLDEAAENASGDREEQLERAADATRETGEAAAEAIDDNDVTNANVK
jgi:protein involved in sex pheromone biosynthesis